MSHEFAAVKPKMLKLPKITYFIVFGNVVTSISLKTLNIGYVAVALDTKSSCMFEVTFLSFFEIQLYAVQKISILLHGRFFVLHPPPPQEIPV